MPETLLPQGSDEPNGELSLLSFVVRLWKEESSSEEHPAVWRGHITLIPDGKRHYFTNVNQIPELIVTHLMRQN